MKRLGVWVTIVGLAYLFASPLFAAESSQLIQKISVSGNQRIETDAIRAVVKEKVGSSLSEVRLREDIQSVYKLGYFKNVQAYFDPSSGTLTFDVEEKTMIAKVEFSGNHEIDKEDLEKEVLTKSYSYFDSSKVHEDIERIKRLYDRKGFYLADIEYQLKNAPQNQKILKFSIKEQKRVLVSRITFIGNKIFSSDELKRVIQTKEKGFLSFLTDSGSYKAEVLDQDRQFIRDFYGHHGYIKARIGAPRVQITTDRRKLTLTFTIEEGELYKVLAVGLDGELIKDATELRSKLKLKEGETVDSLNIQQDLSMLQTLYADEGYAYANVIPKDEYDDEHQLVSITYFLQPGPKVHVERIEFKGNESTRDKVLRREMQLAEGDLFSGTKLKESKQNIERLSLYEEVKMSTPRGSADDKVNVLVEIKEKPTGSFSIGAGFNTIESFQVLGRIEKRNLFGYGVDLSLDAQVGKVTQAFNLQYRDEYLFDTKLGLTVNAFNISRRYPNFDLTSRGGSVGLDYPIYTQGLRRVRGGVTYNLVDEKLSSIRPTVASLFHGGMTSSTTTRLTYDTRNRVFEPSKGTYLELSEEVAGGPFGGANDFSKTELDGRWFYPVNDESSVPIIGGSVFALHFNMGFVAPLKNGERVPLFERYFPGGIFSLRGFPLRSLGPKIQVASSFDPTSYESTDFTIGGNKQAIFNAEYIFPIIRVANIKGVLFFDMGNAFDNGQSLLTLAGQRQSAGFGIRWFSPIGPLRFEWGFPLDKKKDESTLVFDFTIGSLF